MKLKMKGKRPRLRWLDNIDSHLKGENISLKDVLETLISRSTDRSSEVEKHTKHYTFLSLKSYDTTH